MTNRFMMTVAAAALIAGTSFANAQGTGMSREAPSAGSSAQQSAPSSDRGTSAAPMNRNAAEPGMKSTQSEEKSPAAGKNQRADETMQGQKSKGMSSENDNAKGGKDMKAEGRQDQNNMKAEGRQDRNGNMNAESKGAAENKSAAENRSQTTTGQAGAGAKLSSEQRTKITSVIREQHVAPVNNVNFSISVGTRVPHDIAFRPLPAEVMTIYPEWRGYNFVMVRNQILVIDPDTFEIVAVIEA